MKWLVAVIALTVWAQDGGASFEAASVKPWVDGTLRDWAGCQGGPGSSDPGKITCKEVTVRYLLAMAYKKRSQEVFGPDWIDSDRFYIEAKLPTGTQREQVAEMWQRLLAERFKLALHHETRALPGYSLTVAKGGMRLKESSPVAAPPDPPPSGPVKRDAEGFALLRPDQLRGGGLTILYRPGKARMLGGEVTMASLANALSGQLDRVVTDETGLQGKYDLVLNWAPDSTERSWQQTAGASGEAREPGADLFAALERDAGLRLVSKKVDRDVVVVDSGERTPLQN